MKLIILFLNLFITINASGKNLASRAQSLNCFGEINLVNKEIIWLSERAYLRIQTDQIEDAYLEEMKFNDEGGFQMIIQSLDGWNVLTLRADQNDLDKVDIAETHGLIGSPFSLYENGEFVTQINCKVVWRRWD